MRRLLLGVGVALLVAWLLSGVAQIRADEKAVVKRFGRIVARPGPGLRLGLPYGIERIERVPVATVQQIEVGFSPDVDDAQPTPPGLLLTGDRNLITLRVVINYRVGETDADLENYVAQRERVPPVLTRLTEALLAEWTAGHRVDEVLLTGNAALPPWLIPRLQEKLTPYALGVRVLQVTVADLAPPEPVRSAFEEVNRAQASMRTQEANARQEAAQRVRQAKSLARAKEELATATAKAVIEQAEAAATAFRKRADQLAALKQVDPSAYQAIWWAETEKLIKVLSDRKATMTPLDDRLAAEGIQLSAPGKPTRR